MPTISPANRLCVRVRVRVRVRVKVWVGDRVRVSNSIITIGGVRCIGPRSPPP
jgi:hypothetical protein